MAKSTKSPLPGYPKTLKGTVPANKGGKGGTKDATKKNGKN